MTFLKRLRVVTAVLGGTAILAAVATSVLGVARHGTAPPTAPPVAAPRPDGNRMIEELLASKFSKLPVLTYQARDGETLFAWQIKPTLPAAPARPRDVLVLVDTSASQAGRPLHQARQVIEALATTLGPQDLISVWSVNTPAGTRPLTRDFQPAASDDVKTAAASLTELEYGSGATDLKNAFAKALPTLAQNRGRHQLVLLLGDGDSNLNPITEADRLALGTQMDQRDVFFFAVPLGVKVNSNNLHGLASLTGGAVVRLHENVAEAARRANLTDQAKRDAFVDRAAKGEFLNPTADLSDPVGRAAFVERFKAALDTPVLKADKYQFGPEVGEVFPTRLPPLRADRATLVMGKLARPAGAITATVTGSASNGPLTLNLTAPLPAPQVDHFFLNLMVSQWRTAPHKEAPAMLQADRALALASTQVRLYKDEYLTQAVWAITANQYDEAGKLYQAARRIDPTDQESVRGLALVEQLKAGKVSKAELEKRINQKGEGFKIGDARAVIQNGAAPAQPPAGAQPGQPGGGASSIEEALARRRVEEQRYRVLVDTAIRRARQLLRTDPDTAYRDLKQMRDEVAGYQVLGEQSRNLMVRDVETVMNEIFRKGAEIKRQAAAERAQISAATNRLNEFDRQQQDEDRVKARIDAFRQLMQQARYELAYQEAQMMIQERVAKGERVPSPAVASYIIGQHATQLREWKELVRIRQDRFLLTMMQTEKSHIPYPDEPPVHFPPAAVWRELTGMRKERYENSILGPEPSPTQKKLQSILENSRVTYESPLNDTPLDQLLRDLAKRYDVTFIIMEEHFKAEGEMNIREKKPNLTATRLDGLTLGSFLDIVLQSMNATYVVRPDYIEVTTFTRRLEEKVTRVFPVADLAIPIPNSVNQQVLYQNMSVQNNQLAIFGAASLYGGGLNNFLGGGNNNNNPFGQGGGGAGNPFGQGGGQGGNSPFFGGNNQTGGIVGLGGGGNQGQFGNLGGQFGLQGGDNSRLLMQLIYETVAKGEWANVPPPMNGGQGGGMMEEESYLPVQQQNSLGYYPPARALIVRGTSRYHSAGSIKLKKMGDGFAAAPPANPNNGALVIGPNTPKPANPAVKPQPGKDPVAAKPKPRDPFPPDDGRIVIGNRRTLVNPKLDPEVLKKKLDKNPRRMWNQAVDWTVEDPGLIVACAEFLMEFDEAPHAAEILKANLRKGLATDEWAHDALAIALQASQANPVEIERAALSGIDLDPTNTQAYLKAAKVEAELNRHQLAVALCKRAAEIAPDQPAPYANALVYAEKATDVKSDAVGWAAEGLMKRDWPIGEVKYHDQARDKLAVLVKKYEAAGQNTEQLKKALTEETQRDLMIELVWQGAADLDLTVTEPSGGTCSATQKRTTGGGVLRGDVLDQKDDGDRSEVYTAATAFSGTYKVKVTRAFGQPIGGTAAIKVTRFKGTANETHDLITVDLRNPRSIEVKLDGGTRRELAVVSDEPNERRLETTGAPVTRGMSGIGGGVGPAGTAQTSPLNSSNGPALPVVVKSREQVLPGLGGTADIRASYRLNPDRKTFSVRVNPVFATTSGKELTLPTVSLLPGAEK